MATEATKQGDIPIFTEHEHDPALTAVDGGQLRKQPQISIEPSFEADQAGGGSAGGHIASPNTNSTNSPATAGQQLQQSSQQDGAYAFRGNQQNSNEGDIVLPPIPLLPPLGANNSSYPAYPSYSLPQQPQQQPQHFRNGQPYPQPTNYRYPTVQLPSSNQGSPLPQANANAYSPRGSYAPPPSTNNNQQQQNRFLYSGRPGDNPGADLPVLPSLDNAAWQPQNQFEQLRGGNNSLPSINVGGQPDQGTSAGGGSQKRAREWNGHDGEELIDTGSASGSKEGDEDEWRESQGGEGESGEPKQPKAKKAKAAPKQQSLEEIAGGATQAKQPVKKFACPHVNCGRAFARNFNLQSHIKSHLGIRDFNCPECPKSFSRRHDCARHCIAVHHYDKERGKPPIEQNAQPQQQMQQQMQLPPMPQPPQQYQPQAVHQPDEGMA